MATPLVLALMGLFYLVIGTSSERCTFDKISPSQTLTWCPRNEGFFCARLDPAQSNSSFGAYQGMILLNPGGPGVSGVGEALDNASTIQAVVGTNWDIVGFDPRGMWLSEPVADCSANITSDQVITLRSKTVPRVTDDFYNSFIQFGKDLGGRCEKTTGGEKDAGPHMSTATTARDMLSIVNAFAETEDGERAAKPNHLLHFYRVSYGTFLSQTFASMFPESVGNVVLDGVMSPESYLTNYTSESVNHLDGIIAAFFIYCHKAGPADCSYYTGSTPKDIYERFNRSFVQLDPRKAEADNWSNATDLETALLVLKVGLLSTANEPFSYFGLLPQTLVDLESALSTQHISPWAEQAMTIFGDPRTAGYEHPEWSLAVLCSDQNNTPQLEEIEHQSIIGEIWIKSALGCTGWPIKATEIFTGPFGGDTAIPILFVGNTHDPVTPIDNALSSAPHYPNSQVLTVDGMGHTTIATRNTCGLSKISAYFQTGKLPGNKSFCPLEQGPFGIVLNGTLKENIIRAGFSGLVD
ncbi:TAP-like protein-domain-containing protein [Pseudomassariella vexata]|uniref:TAP-like protein-domain-containing protein n=1 Tax=Pseudomassariella vexata TaxID=1141098 RepID=A0A1Y2DLD1_9PEZI|nr:TAP-like protein-domain-containing protein [Pseudomassariella vexata]ORY59959.1 TAP-like protein-domain-containing protein [Pseudomassariella vexata]